MKKKDRVRDLENEFEDELGTGNKDMHDITENEVEEAPENNVFEEEKYVEDKFEDKEF